jgi:hypothetical protein
MKKGEKPPTLPAESPVVRGGLLLPVADEETLIDSFKRYVALKDKLLEESDYVWFAVYKMGDKVDRKGFGKRDEAERCVAELRKKPGIEADLEKRVKKSGCLKLGKAFGISTEIVAEKIDREKGYAEYTVRATAPNGQYKDKTGSCDRAERGKSSAPFDTIMATANTRAEDRALMVLLGGETTAEEFEDGAAPREEFKPIEIKGEPLSHSIIKARGGDPNWKPPTETKEPPLPPPMTNEEAVAAINKKFSETPPAKSVDLNQLRGQMFAAMKEANVTPEQLKGGIKNKFKKDSSKDLTEAELLEATRLLKEWAKDKGNPLANEPKK